MFFIREILFGVDVDKKAATYTEVVVSWEIIPAAFHSSYLQ
jgi:hypothetical protein